MARAALGGAPEELATGAGCLQPTTVKRWRRRTARWGAVDNDRLQMRVRSRRASSSSRRTAAAQGCAYASGKAERTCRQQRLCETKPIPAIIVVRYLSLDGRWICRLLAAYGIIALCHGNRLPQMIVDGPDQPSPH